MITRVRLIDWMSHKDTSISFNKGKVLIFGKNGAGKTSIIEGVLYGMFGSITDSYRSIAKTNKKDFIRDGAKSATIDLEFIIQERKINVKRTVYVGNKGEESSLYINGMLKTRNSEEVGKEIEKMLGVDREVFLKVLYGAQDGIYKILTLRPKDLKAYLDTIFGIDLYQTRLDKLNAMRRVIDKEIKDRLSSSLSEKKEFELKLKSLEEEINILKEDRERLKREIQEAEQQEQKLRQNMPKLEENLRKYNNLQSEVDKLRAKWAYIKDELKKLEEESRRYEKELGQDTDREYLKRKLEEIEKRLAEINEKRKEYQEINSKIFDLNKEIENINLEIHRINNLKSNKMKEYYDREDEIRKLDQHIKNLEVSRRNVVLLGAIVTILGLVLLPTYLLFLVLLIDLIIAKVYIQNKKEQEQLEKRREELNREKDNINAEIDEYNKKLEQYQKNTELLTTSRQELEHRLQQINDTDEEMLRKEEQNLIRKEELLNRKEIIDSKIKEYINMKEKIHSELSKKEQELESLEYVSQEYLYTTNKISSLESKRKSMMGTIRQIETSIAARTKDREEVLNKLKIYEQKVKELESKRELWKELGEIGERMNGVMIKNRERLIDILNLNLEKYWNSLYYGKIYEDPRIEVNEDGGYELKIKTGGKLVNVDRMSGGEKTIYALAMRLGILDVISKRLRVMILDEPTHNLDDLSIDSLIDNMNKLALESVDQFIIITHDDRLKMGVNWNQQLWLDREKTRDPSINYTRVG